MQTFTGIEYLKIDIASNFGLGKSTWDERLAWADSNEADLETLVSQAEEPAMYFAGVQAYRKAQKGQATGYAISLDATASGLQLLSCLTGCEDSARLCNVVNSGNREDAYKLIYKAMCDEIGDTAKISHDDTKQAIMTSLYSSTAVPKQVFGEGELLKVFYETMEKMAPGAWALNHALQQLWQADALSHDWVMPDNFNVHIPVLTPVTKYVQFLNEPVAVTTNENIGTKEGKSISPNIVHSIDGMIVREMHRRCSYNQDTLQILIMSILKQEKHGWEWGTRTGRKQDTMVQTIWARYKTSGFLSARILDHLDAENMGHVDPTAIKDLIKSLPDTPFPVISIHDCFRVSPNKGNDLRQQYNEILADIAASELLSYIASQILGNYLPIVKAGDIASKVRKADYALS